MCLLSFVHKIVRSYFSVVQVLLSFAAPPNFYCDFPICKRKSVGWKTTTSKSMQVHKRKGHLKCLLLRHQWHSTRKLYSWRCHSEAPNGLFLAKARTCRMSTKVLQIFSEQQKADLGRNLPQNCIWSVDWSVSHTTSQENEHSTTVAWYIATHCFRLCGQSSRKCIVNIYIFFCTASAAQFRILCTQNWSIHPTTCIIQLFGQRSNPQHWVSNTR